MTHHPPHPAGAPRRPLSPSRGEGKKSVSAAQVRPSPLEGEGGVRSTPGEGDFVADRKGMSRARALRRNMTDAERKLWGALRGRRFLAFKFRRQAPIGPYVADFVCLQSKLLVEVDGSQHAESSHDAARDVWFAERGYRTLRFWNPDVLKNLDGVLESIAAALAERSA